MDFFDTSFWQGFLGNLLATIIGVAIGVPVAFWINRRVEDITEKEKREKILVLLWIELKYNLIRIVNLRKRSSDPLTLITFGARMSDEIWNAFSDGGELEWIKDPAILSQLADAYREIRKIRYFSDKYLYYNSFPAAVTDILLPQLQKAIEEAQQEIERVMATIEKHADVKNRNKNFKNKDKPS